jgi:glutathione synthase/RimK-type ligase-like ATP-grasp enzyme
MPFRVIKSRLPGPRPQKGIFIASLAAKDGPYLIEVNASPGFKGLMRATDVDVPGKIIEYAVEKARK